MGKDKRARRRARAASAHRPSPGWRAASAHGTDGADEHAAVATLITQALHALDVGMDALVDDAAVTLAGRCASPTTRRDVVMTLLDSLTAATTAAWQHGWQPSDVHRLAGRRLGVAEQALVVDVMTHELSRYAPATVDRRWWAQLSELGADPWWDRSATLLDAQRERGVDWFTLMSRTLTVLHLITRLPVLELLTPVPGTAVAPSSAGGGTDDRPAVDERILSKVRMLLAKAESTTFEAEAETFTAGAQSLMARHSIDAALLAASGAARHRDPTAPEGRRIGIDNPYDGPKAMLLNAVASANRCRMVWSRELGFGTVVGFESDLDGVEVLFTSLLVQATRTLTSAGSRTDRHGGSRTRAFRQSFLTAYASRIGERLREVTAAEEAAASENARSSGRELVPLLEARAEEVDDAVSTWFPELQTHSVGAVRDAEGWHSGRAAADRAELGAGPAITH
ncbi:uncharacterized protein DUF2786 [Humibacillus xanthopallidus]|uniref:Uncharacterized protein DUF2786 n=2 Tax=Humibacillus xanthopallidus TaxID=412689 RepID=A0A543HG20_9MICO|nr:uncharacterized protein DUF2786 [Humibacillus xanthopallidus]